MFLCGQNLCVLCSYVVKKLCVLCSYVVNNLCVMLQLISFIKSNSPSFKLILPTMNIIIRKAVKGDMPQVLELIKELALYEKAPEEVTNTVENMIKDGFDEPPVFLCDVAEIDNTVVGMAIYFIKYSTWKGKGIYLDDILVTEKMRGNGIGKLLFDNVVKVSLETGAKQLHWQVLDWNTPAINFYKKYPTDFDNEWVNCKLTKSQLEKLNKAILSST